MKVKMHYDNESSPGSSSGSALKKTTTLFPTLLKTGYHHSIGTRLHCIS